MALLIQNGFWKLEMATTASLFTYEKDDWTPCSMNQNGFWLFKMATTASLVTYTKGRPDPPVQDTLCIRQRGAAFLQNKPNQTVSVLCIHSVYVIKALLSTKQTKTNQENNQAIYRWAVKQKENALAGEITAESKKILLMLETVYISLILGGGGILFSEYQLIPFSFYFDIFLYIFQRVRISVYSVTFSLLTISEGGQNLAWV